MHWIIVAPRWFRLFAFKFVNAITLWPFILVRYHQLKEDAYLIHHEKIHLRQQLEMGVLLFFIWYIVEYIIRLIQYRQPLVAYRNISFEREAYAHEAHSDYLLHRSFWRFLKYLTQTPH